MARYRQFEWSLRGEEDARTVENSQVQLALLMDLRDLLRDIRNRLEGTLGCSAFIAIPRHLEAIRRNTHRRPVRKKRR